MENICRNKQKKKSLQEEVLTDIDLEELDEQVNFENVINLLGRNPVDIIVEKELMEAVKMAYMKLPKNYQDIIRFRDNGMSSEQIASLSGQTIDGVNSMHYKAFLAWKKIFKEIYKM